MGNAILSVDLGLLKRMFHLPEGYSLLTVRHHGGPVVQFLVASEAIPEAKDLPNIDLHCTVETHPDNPDFRKLTVVPKMNGKDIKEDARQNI